MASVNWGELVKEAASSSTSFQPIPADTYDLKVVEATAGKTKNGEKTMFTLKTEVQSGPYARRLIWDRITVTPENSAAMGFFFRKMNALGLPLKYFEASPTNEQIAQAINGRPFKGKVIIDNNQPENPQNRIDTYLAPAKGAEGVSPSAPAAPAAGPTPPPPPAPAAPAEPWTSTSAAPSYSGNPPF